MARIRYHLHGHAKEVGRSRIWGPVCPRTQYHRLLEEDGVYRVASQQLLRQHRLSIGTITSDASLMVQYLRGKRLGMNELLIEQIRTREGHHLCFYPFEGLLVHEGLATLLAFRMARQMPISFSMTINDYGLELLSPDPIPLMTSIRQGLFHTDNLLDDIRAGLNSVEMARRQFREIARVAGLVFLGYPGSGMTVKQMQVSTELLYDTFRNYDPENLLLRQAEQEVLERQLEQSRLQQAFSRLSNSRIVVTRPPHPTPCIPVDGGSVAGAT